MSQPPKPTKLKVLPDSLKDGKQAQIFAPKKGGYTLKGKGGTVALKAQPKAQPKPNPKPKQTAPKPAPKPVSAPAKEAEPKSKTVELAGSFFDTLMGRLINEAIQKGGHLSVADLENFGKATKQNPQGLQLDFQHSLDEFVETQKKASLEETRGLPFERLMVKKFAHMFATKEGPTFEDGGLSRRVLPGFFTAVNMMLGPEMVQLCQLKTNANVQRIKKANGDGFSWVQVYTDMAANKIVLDALVDIASYFEDMEKRIHWMLDLVINSMNAPTREMNKEEAAWEMTEKHLYRLLNSLFLDLRKALGTETARQSFAQKHGPATLKKVVRILKTINAEAG